MFNTIIIVIIAIVFSIYVVRVANGISNNKFNINDLIIVIITLGIIINMRAMPNKLEEAYNQGYDDAVGSAELIEIGNYGYYIKYDTEVHEYLFDIED